MPPLIGEVPVSTLMLARDGSLMRLSLAEDGRYRLPVRLTEICPEAVEALFLYEDRYFRHHPGVNPLAMGRAVLSMLMGSRRMGASTITMQVARMRYVPVTSSIPGKIRQVLTALRMERQFTKDEILEAYFNLAPYGSNVEGIGAAARVWFHKSVVRLTLGEIAALTVVPQNPVRRCPLGGPDFDVARYRLEDMLGKGDDARPPLRVFSPKSLPFEAPHVTEEILAGRKKGEKERTEDREVWSRVRTTLDLAAQHTIERALADYVRRNRVRGVDNACVLLVHAPTMEVRALAGAADFFSARIHGQVDGTAARRSPGSTLKPFIYALGVEQGVIHPRTILLDNRKSFAGYDPENFDREFKGPLAAEEALRASRNIPAIWLAARLRNPNLYEFLSNGGVAFARDADHYGLSLVLGGAEVTARELAALYGMLANHGIYRPIHILKTENGGEPGRRLLSPEAAYITQRMLRAEGLEMRTSDGRTLGVRIKTGTSNGFHDAWCVGTFGPWVLVTWVGDFANRPGSRFVGGEHAVPLWRNLARILSWTGVGLDRDAHGHQEPQWEDRGDIPRELNVIEIPVCADTGDTDVSLCTVHATTLFIPGVSPVRQTGVYRRILLDKKTGLRACVPDSEETEEVVWQFWPSEHRRLFRQAGVEKPAPPPFLPQCRPAEGGMPEGRVPEILQPAAGITYMRSRSRKAAQSIPLVASTEADVKVVFWFDGDAFLGKVEAGRPLLVDLPPGRHRLQAVDELGRSSHRTVDVKEIP